jgi:hypothetical protein
MLRTTEDQSAERQAEIARRSVYADVEMLVSPGFLAHDIRVCGVDFSMRSFCAGDLFLLRHRVGLLESSHTWKLWAISSSVWMVDGQLLLEAPHATNRIYAVLKGLPRRMVDIMFSIVVGLSNRVSRAFDVIEAYCYESHSRSRWRGLNGLLPGEERITGIPGSHRLGQNALQRIWTVFHRSEDEHEDWLRHWQAAKFMASAHNPKGVKSVSRKDESQTKAEKARRQRVIDETCWRITGRLPGLDRPRLYRAVTADDLVDEMKRWVSGDHDFHDQVVADYKEKIRQRMAEERQRKIEEEQARVAHAQAEAASDPSASTSRPLVGYTLDQLSEITKDRPAGRKKGGSVIYEGSNADYLYEKFVAKDIKAGSIRTDGKAVPAQPQESNLQQQISNRRVVLTPPKSEGND